LAAMRFNCSSLAILRMFILSNSHRARDGKIFFSAER
jgi:hypothetical protein